MDTPHATEPPAERGLPSGPVTAAVGLTVAVVTLIFLFESNWLPSHWYGFFKLVHVVGAVVWVGGGLIADDPRDAGRALVRSPRDGDDRQTGRVRRANGSSPPSASSSS